MPNYTYFNAELENSFTRFSAEVVAEITADLIPDQFTFTDQTSVALSTVIESALITVLGVDAAENIAISITGGEYSIDGGAYTSIAGTVQLNQTVKVRITSSGLYNTAVNTTLTIGGVVDVFSATTLADPATPTQTSLLAQFKTLVLSTQVTTNSATCTKCTNTTNSTDCNNSDALATCTDCHDSNRLTNCNGCYKCDDSNDCTRCSASTFLATCIECHHSNNLTNCNYCTYTTASLRSNNCKDSDNLTDCEDLDSCSICTTSYQSRDLTNCTNCFLCIGLTNKTTGYWLFNASVTQADFDSHKAIFGY